MKSTDMPTSTRAGCRFLLLTVLLLLPIDWFSPTGLILREAGAKPLNVFLIGLFGWYCLRYQSLFRAPSRLPMQTVFALILFSGTAAFLASPFFQPHLPPSDRSQLVQFFTQSAMMILFMVEIQVLTYLFNKPGVRVQVLRVLPIAASLHFGVFLMESAGFFSGGSIGPLALFRNESGLIERASGLMSEPSYYGTFAALFATPLLLLGGHRPVFNRILAMALLISAFLVQAKTMYLVLGAQFICLLLMGNKRLRLRGRLWVAIAVMVPTALYMSVNTEVLNLEENLSSINRLGSSILAWRVASDGYGLLGIGTGQFHFYYISRFAPDFLMLSQEATDQMTGLSTGRASTFNLPLRLLVETGVLGATLFAGLIFASFLSVRKSSDPATLTGMCFVAGSLGFLMTQDSYCLPSLAFGLALAMTEPSAKAPT